MARPKKKVTKKPVKLTLDPELRKLSDAHASARNQSLSELVTELLESVVPMPRLALDEQPQAPYGDDKPVKLPAKPTAPATKQKKQA
jgi:hypothetical protein